MLAKGLLCEAITFSDQHQAFATPRTINRMISFLCASRWLVRLDRGVVGQGMTLRRFLAVQESLGTALGPIRVRAGLSLTRVALRLQEHPNITMAREANRLDIKVSDVRKICVAYNVDINCLLAAAEEEKG